MVQHNRLVDERAKIVDPTPLIVVMNEKRPVVKKYVFKPFLPFLSLPYYRLKYLKRSILQNGYFISEISIFLDHYQQFSMIYLFDINYDIP